MGKVVNGFISDNSDGKDRRTRRSNNSKIKSKRRKRKKDLEELHRNVLKARQNSRKKYLPVKPRPTAFTTVLTKFADNRQENDDKVHGINGKTGKRGGPRKICDRLLPKQTIGIYTNGATDNLVLNEINNARLHEDVLKLMNEDEAPSKETTVNKSFQGLKESANSCYVQNDAGISLSTNFNDSPIQINTEENLNINIIASNGENESPKVQKTPQRETDASQAPNGFETICWSPITRYEDLCSVICSEKFEGRSFLKNCGTDCLVKVKEKLQDGYVRAFRTYFSRANINNMEVENFPLKTTRSTDNGDTAKKEVQAEACYIDSEQSSFNGVLQSKKFIQRQESMRGQFITSLSTDIMQNVSSTLLGVKQTNIYKPCGNDKHSKNLRIFEKSDISFNDKESSHDAAKSLLHKNFHRNNDEHVGNSSKEIAIFPDLEKSSSFSNAPYNATLAAEDFHLHQDSNAYDQQCLDAKNSKHKPTILRRSNCVNVIAKTDTPTSINRPKLWSNIASTDEQKNKICQTSPQISFCNVEILNQKLDTKRKQKQEFKMFSLQKNVCNRQLKEKSPTVSTEAAHIFGPTKCKAVNFDIHLKPMSKVKYLQQNCHSRKVCYPHQEATMYNEYIKGDDSSAENDKKGTMNNLDNYYCINNAMSDKEGNKGELRHTCVQQQNLKSCMPQTLSPLTQYYCQPSQNDKNLNVPKSPNRQTVPTQNSLDNGDLRQHSEIMSSIVHKCQQFDNQDIHVNSSHDTSLPTSLYNSFDSKVQELQLRSHSMNDILSLRSKNLQCQHISNRDKCRCSGRTETSDNLRTIMQPIKIIQQGSIENDIRKHSAQNIGVMPGKDRSDITILDNVYNLETLCIKGSYEEEKNFAEVVDDHIHSPLLQLISQPNKYIAYESDQKIQKVPVYMYNNNELIPTSTTHVEHDSIRQTPCLQPRLERTLSLHNEVPLTSTNKRRNQKTTFRKYGNQQPLHVECVKLVKYLPRPDKTSYQQINLNSIPLVQIEQAPQNLKPHLTTHIVQCPLELCDTSESKTNKMISNTMHNAFDKQIKNQVNLQNTQYNLNTNTNQNINNKKSSYVPISNQYKKLYIPVSKNYLCELQRDQNIHLPQCHSNV